MLNIITYVLLIAGIFSLTSGGAVQTQTQTNNTITFAGQTWKIKSGAAAPPGPNNWSNSSRAVFVDTKGRLHLKIIKENGTWYSAEVVGKKSFGYGTYDFTFVSPMGNLDPNVIASPYLYLDDYHEIDIEFAKWTEAKGKNVFYTVQPAGEESDFGTKLTLNSHPVTARIVWKPDSVAMYMIQDGIIKSSWHYYGDHNFEAGWEAVHINYWLVNGLAPVDGREHEIIISSFTFKPLP